jgi:hypothetical protein
MRALPRDVVFLVGKGVPWMDVAQRHDARNTAEAGREQSGVPDSTVRGEAGATCVESSTEHAGGGVCVVSRAQTVFAQNEAAEVFAVRGVLR